MKCKEADGTKTTVTWRLFYPACPKINANCNPLGGAYLAAVTICAQRLY